MGLLSGALLAIVIADGVGAVDSAVCLVHRELVSQHVLLPEHLVSGLQKAPIDLLLKLLHIFL